MRAGAVPLSSETYRELEATGQFDMLDAAADEVRQAGLKAFNWLVLD